ncbi:hypothetical protein VTK73DRAFT_9875 [Phialemonium thermophilum]|uniref:Uncharacterized protein n=1 Tax=Phialemonium thermophilum TaxID=223376 RepID=A0ABR3W023_9PEZI
MHPVPRRAQGRGSQDWRHCIGAPVPRYRPVVDGQQRGCLRDGARAAHMAERVLFAGGSSQPEKGLDLGAPRQQRTLETSSIAASLRRARQRASPLRSTYTPPTRIVVLQAYAKRHHRPAPLRLRSPKLDWVPWRWLLLWMPPSFSPRCRPSQQDAMPCRAVMRTMCPFDGIAASARPFLILRVPSGMVGQARGFDASLPVPPGRATYWRRTLTLGTASRSHYGINTHEDRFTLVS